MGVSFLQRVYMILKRGSYNSYSLKMRHEVELSSLHVRNPWTDFKVGGLTNSIQTH